MRDAVQVDVLVGAKDKHLPPLDAATRVFSNFRGCRILSAACDGSRLKVSLLLPDVPGGYRDTQELRPYVEEGLFGKGAVLAAVHGLREATATEVLGRLLSRRL
jgi:hypothetical protein